MVNHYNDYKLWCSTENKWVYNTLNINDTRICPHNKDHILDLTKTTVLHTITNTNQNGFLMKKNITNIPLGPSGVFDGEYENVLDYSEFSVILHSDTTGTLEIDMSINGITSDKTISYEIIPNQKEYHSYPVISQYAKVKFINGPIQQTNLQLSSIGHINNVNNLSYKTNDIINNNNDVQLIRISNDINLDLARGIHKNNKVIHKFGTNELVGNNMEDIWDVGGNYPWENFHYPVFLQVNSKNIEDGISGKGALSIFIEGLDSNLDEHSEIIPLIGNSTTYSTNQYNRINRTCIYEVGTYHGANYNDIDICISGTSTIVSRIGGKTIGGVLINTPQYGNSQTQQAIYTVPRNKTAYITRIEVVVDTSSNKNATIFLYRVDDFTNNHNTFSPRKILWRIDNFIGNYTTNFKSYLQIPEKSDIWFRARASADSSITVNFDLYLVDN